MTKPPGPWLTDGTPLERARLYRKARRDGALLRWGFRLAGGPWTRAEQVEFGAGAWIGTRAWFTIGTATARLSIGEDCSIAPGAQFSFAEEVTIGAGCLISEHFTIVDSDHDWEAWTSRAARGEAPPRFTWEMTTPAPSHIGPGCFIGRNVIVGSGVTVGECSVIGAMSVVTRDIPPYSVAVGTPARVIRDIRDEQRA